MNYLLVILVYALFLTAVGLYFHRKVKTSEDFIVAGRSLSAPVLVGTLVATWTGSGSLFNGGRLAYENGYASLWASAGGWLGMILLFFIASKIRRGEHLSVPHILENRYNSIVGLAATITTTIAYVTIVSYQLRGGGRVLEIIFGDQLTLFGLSSFMSGVIITTIFTICYTILAGMLSVTFTDVIQGCVFLIGLMISIPVMISGVGGFQSIASEIPSQKWQLFGTMGPLKAIGYLLPVMFLILGDANMVQRFLSAKDEKTARLSVVGMIAGVFIVDVLIATMGLIGSIYEPNLNGVGTENIILLVAKNHLSFVVGSLIFTAAIAMIISTADSYLLVPSINITHDLYARFINPSIQQEKLLIGTRWVILVLGLVAFVMVSFFESILEAAYAAYTVYGASITPPLIGGYIWKRASTMGAILSIVGGTVVTITSEILKKMDLIPFGELNTIYPALFVSMLLFFGGSLLYPDRKG